MGQAVKDVSLSEECFREFVRLAYEFTGVAIASNRIAMVEGRLRRRMNGLGCACFEDYLGLLRTNPSEKAAFMDLITTHETSFFRTPRIWQHIENVFLPDWNTRERGRLLNAWSAAASSGEEAYSLAMTLQEFGRHGSPFGFKIIGTDISAKMIAHCREGLYQGRSVEQLQGSRPALFKKYLRPQGAGFLIDDALKANVQFLEHNLHRGLPSCEKFDLVLLRNVLIYFKPSDQVKVLEKIHSRMADGGVLILGESESLSSLESIDKPTFTPIAPLVYKRQQA